MLNFVVELPPIATDAVPVEIVTKFPETEIVAGEIVPLEPVTWPVPGGNSVVVPPGVVDTGAEEGMTGSEGDEGGETDEGDVVVATTVNA